MQPVELLMASMGIATNLHQLRSPPPRVVGRSPPRNRTVSLCLTLFWSPWACITRRTSISPRSFAVKAGCNTMSAPNHVRAFFINATASTICGNNSFPSINLTSAELNIFASPRRKNAAGACNTASKHASAHAGALYNWAFARVPSWSSSGSLRTFRLFAKVSTARRHGASSPPDHAAAKDTASAALPTR